MNYSGLQDFIKRLDRSGELVRIKHPVSADLEITEISDRVMKSPGGGKALLFENVAGHSMPLAINLFGSRKRMAWALGVHDLEEIAENIESLVKLPGNMPKGLSGVLGLAPTIMPLANLAPKMVTTAPCQQIIKLGADASLDEIPILKCWPDDGGPYITLPMVFTKEAATGKRNVGMYRIQKFDAHTTGMHWQRHKVGSRHFAEYESQGRDIPVAIVLGGDPVLTYAATAPLPDQIDELIFAAYLRKRPVELVKCVSIDIEVPADAEIVIEGVVPANERRLEGPFGDHTGYYSLADQYPVFHVTAITMRSRPVYPATIVGPPPMEDAWLGKATERIFLPLVKFVVPEIIDYNLPVEGAFHNMALVKIKKRYPGHAYKVMHALWGLGQMMFTKVIIVVDEDVDVQNPADVVWRTLANIDPERDVTFVKGPADVLDHASVGPAFGSKMGIDGTRKWPEEGFTREWPDVLKCRPKSKRESTDFGSTWGFKLVLRKVDVVNDPQQSIFARSGDLQTVSVDRGAVKVLLQIDPPDDGVERERCTVEIHPHLKACTYSIECRQIRVDAGWTQIAYKPMERTHILRRIELDVDRRKLRFNINVFAGKTAIAAMKADCVLS